MNPLKTEDIFTCMRKQCIPVGGVGRNKLEERWSEQRNSLYIFLDSCHSSALCRLFAVGATPVGDAKTVPVEKRINSAQTAYLVVLAIVRTYQLLTLRHRERRRERVNQPKQEMTCSLKLPLKRRLLLCPFLRPQ